MTKEDFIHEAEKTIVRELSATQQLKDCLDEVLRVCMQHYELVASEIGKEPLEEFVNSLKPLIEFLTSLIHIALDRVEFISHAKLVLLNGTTPKHRKEVLNGVYQMAKGSRSCGFIRRNFVRYLASDFLMRFRITLT